MGDQHLRDWGVVQGERGRSGQSDVSVAFAKGGDHFDKEEVPGKSVQTSHIRHGVA